MLHGDQLIGLLNEIWENSPNFFNNRRSCIILLLYLTLQIFFTEKAHNQHFYGIFIQKILKFFP